MRCSTWVIIVSWDGIEVKLQCQDNMHHSGPCDIALPYKLLGQEVPDAA